jgi:hypothetical protein
LATRVVVDGATSRVVNPSASHVVLHVSLEVAAFSSGTRSFEAVDTIGIDASSKGTSRNQSSSKSEKKDSKESEARHFLELNNDSNYSQMYAFYTLTKNIFTALTYLQPPEV